MKKQADFWVTRSREKEEGGEVRWSVGGHHRPPGAEVGDVGVVIHGAPHQAAVKRSVEAVSSQRRVIARGLGLDVKDEALSLPEVRRQIGVQSCFVSDGSGCHARTSTGFSADATIRLG